MLKISEETTQSVLNYIAGSRSDFPFGEVFKLTQQLMQLEKVEDESSLNSHINGWIDSTGVTASEETPSG